MPTRAKGAAGKRAASSAGAATRPRRTAAGKMAASAADSGEVGGIDGGSEAAAAAGGGGNKTKRRGAAKPAAKRRRRSPTSQKATDADSKGGSATSDGNGRSEKASTSKKRRANPRWWSAEEDALLRKAVEEFGERNWKKISERVPERTHVQCLQRWKKVLCPGLVKGHWTDQEDELLRSVVASGKKNWGQVATFVSGRTAKQCRERWCNHLDPSIKRGGWTPKEDELLLMYHGKVGARWAYISRFLQGRTENAVKIRYKSLQRRSNRDTGFDPEPIQRTDALGAVGGHTGHGLGTAGGGVGHGTASVHSVLSSAAAAGAAARRMAPRAGGSRVQSVGVDQQGVSHAAAAAMTIPGFPGQSAPGLPANVQGVRGGTPLAQQFYPSMTAEQAGLAAFAYGGYGHGYGHHGAQTLHGGAELSAAGVPGAAAASVAAAARPPTTVAEATSAAQSTAIASTGGVTASTSDAAAAAAADSTMRWLQSGINSRFSPSEMALLRHNVTGHAALVVSAQMGSGNGATSGGGSVPPDDPFMAAMTMRRPPIGLSNPPFAGKATGSGAAAFAPAAAPTATAAASGGRTAATAESAIVSAMIASPMSASGPPTTASATPAVSASAATAPGSAYNSTSSALQAWSYLYGAPNPLNSQSGTLGAMTDTPGMFGLSPLGLESMAAIGGAFSQSPSGAGGLLPSAPSPHTDSMLPMLHAMPSGSMAGASFGLDASVGGRSGLLPGATTLGIPGMQGGSDTGASAQSGISPAGSGTETATATSEAATRDEA